MLDEPTNHLDMHSVDLLADALDNYQGSLILVSHDRYFISKTANKIWEIVDGKIVEFKGGYTEWVEWKERMEKKALENEKTVGGKDKSKQKSGNATDIKQEVKSKEPVQIKPESSVPNNLPIDKEKQKEKKKLQKQFDEIEIKISSLKTSIKDAETALGDPAIYSDHGKFVEAEKKYNQFTNELRSLEKTSEELFEKLMELGD